jgi:hypothetical protein
MGGAKILIRDAESNEILARGVTAGTTGDTEKIMKESMRHHAPVSTPEAGVFHAKLDVERPTRVRIEARGPVVQPQSAATAHVTQWIIPGKHVTAGDAVMLELPGFAVDVLHPPSHQKLSPSTEKITVRANVTMMCGCPVRPDGLWDANEFEVAAYVYRDGEKLSEVPLEYAGETSQFQAKIDISEAGAYVMTVYAFDPANGNSGVDKTSVIVPE